MRRPLLILVVLAGSVGAAALGVGLYRRGVGGSTMAPSWYDATPLLASIRPSERAGLANAAAVTRLEELPLYDLDVRVDPDGAAATIREELWLTQREDRALEDIELRVEANAPGELSSHPSEPPVRFVRGACTGPIGCRVVSSSASGLRVVPERALSHGDRIRIVLDLEATLRRIDRSRTNVLAQGLEGISMLASSEGAGDYGLLAVGDGIVSLANFYGVVGRRRDGRWLPPPRSPMGDLGSDDLANVRAKIHAPSGVKWVTSGVELAAAAVGAERDGGSETVTDVGAAAVREFAVLGGRTIESSARDVGGVAVRSTFLAEERAAGERVLDVAARALGFFERRFGAYPYADLDVVEAPLVGGAGGVEFSGLVTIASMLYRAPDSGASGLGALLGALSGDGGPLDAMRPMLDSMIEFTTAHEVAHQFWHGLVGSDSRDHPYVDEALAQYSALLYMEDRYGPERASHESDLEIKVNYQMMRLLGHEDAAADRGVDDFASPVEYAGLVYGKAPLLYAALRKEIGDEAFFQALRGYVDRYRFRLAPARGLVDICATGDRKAGVETLARRWLDERHGDEDIGGGDASAMLRGVLGDADTQSLGPLLDMAGGLLGLDPAPSPASPSAAPRAPRAPRPPRRATP